MKTMLSMPRTSSSAVSVAKAIHAWGSASSSSMRARRRQANRAKAWSRRPIIARFAAAATKLASKLFLASA